MSAAGKRVLVAGGRGFIGRAIQKDLMNKGYRVSVVSRSSVTDSDNSETDSLTWDQLKQNGIPQCEAIINLAGYPILDLGSRKAWGANYMQECVDSRVETTRLLAEAAAESKTKPEVLICTSGVGYYPASSSAKYTEEYVSCAQTDGWGCMLTHKVEDAAAPASENGIRTVAMRMGVVMGRGGGAYGNMKLPFYMGVGGAFGDGKQWFPWIHLKDAAGLYTFAIENKEVSGPLNAASPGCLSNGAFCNTLASAMWRPAIFDVPAFVLERIGPERAALLLEGQNVIPKKALDNGYKFEYPTAGACCDELVNGTD